MSSEYDDVLGGDAAGSGASSRTPPYVSFATLLTFLKALKADGLPPQIDKSVLSKLSGGVQGQMKLALRSLGLMEGDKPTDELDKLVNAFDTPDFEPVLLERLKATYPYVFALDLMTATPTMLADAFKTANKDAKEDVLRKCRTFFLHAAKRAGVPLGNRILTGSVPRSPSNGPRRKPKAKTPEVPAQNGDSGKEKQEKKSGKDHPLVDGLLLTLPDPGKKWDIDSRVSWLRMAAFIFENIYDGKGSIAIDKIETEKPEKKAATDQ